MSEKDCLKNLATIRDVSMALEGLFDSPRIAQWPLPLVQGLRLQVERIAGELQGMRELLEQSVKSPDEFEATAAKTIEALQAWQSNPEYCHESEQG